MSAVTISGTPIRLWCLVRGSSSTFKVVIGNGNDIYDLKKLIKAEKQNAFANVDANQLILWRVNINQSQIKTTSIDSMLKDEDKLEISGSTVGEVFQNTEGNIRVFVEAPILAEQPSATGKRSHSLSFSELDEPHNNQNLKRNKISLDSLLELRQHISVDKSPVIFVPFVSRPNIQKQICDEIYVSTLLVYGSNRRQDYRGIIISGGSGVGKTRIGFEIENFIVNDERIRTRMDSLKITFKHIFIRMNEIINLLGKEQESFPGTNKYPWYPEDIDKAEEVLIMLIAIYFFAGVWTLTSIKNCKELIPKIKNYNEIINLIRKEMKLDQDALLILILQIDEFQVSTYWTVTLLRVISRIVDTNKTLIISVCTGTAPSRILDLSNDRSSIFSVSQYQTTNINLSPMSFSESEKNI